MGYTAQLTIPKVNGENLKLYVYRSTNFDDINTISKVANMLPVLVIDQSTANTVYVNGKECYQILDKNDNVTGVTYNGPEINNVPITEYETEINLVNINTYTFVNELILKPLVSNKNGTMYYYSVLAVNSVMDQISHLSKVNGVLVQYIEDYDLTRQIYCCDNYENKETDQWHLVNNLSYSELDNNIRIGDVTRSYNISSLGLPMVETVPQIQEMHVALNSLISNTFMVLEIQNPWQNNNQEFNYRKLKSYKIRNVYQSLYSDFSVPTFQSTLPVSIEKMVIMMATNPDDQNVVISMNDENAKKFEVIRKDGIYYDKIKHKSLGYNQWNIPLESNKLSVFSESSIQDTINIQVSGVTGNLYVFDIYLIDVYQNVSQNTHYILET